LAFNRGFEPKSIDKLEEEKEKKKKLPVFPDLTGLGV